MTEIKQSFDQLGYAILPAFYSAAQVDDVVQSIEQRKLQRPMNVTVDLLDTGERSLLGLLSPREIETLRMKINDLYLDMESVRELALSERIAAVLKDLLGHAPALCNSLYFEKGSQQPPHVDAIYMTPKTDDHLIAIWVALEDAHVDAGQLEYYPGSHKIEQLIFSNGNRHFVPEEMPRWHSYMDSEVERHGLKKTTFFARKGDVLIWHANLLHGGSAIADPTRTRKSLVFHYFSEADARSLDCKLREANSCGYWIDRPIQEVPEAAFNRAEFEKAYLAKYEDVANAVQAGQFASGTHHYEVCGRAEGRFV
ncbi:phytanoyl-CoA dioxygenase family protein [Paraburkholderia sprentiae WSM5005]|uniref:Phytanoyl-CoA dioxygenase family protein n=1 Tax=Paraburkholderia sprentiae WSM5005 TaxID=754502 RepID=A0A1I9YGJ7_9BURK|nr:phytanoyl-CoA dioxygenase family protein [Paraburkholderia sprentiae]APA85430.1 phytanoyl-CoA dioxygenase family protein [Paraburkholderia sprentiae WSM5005]